MGNSINLLNLVPEKFRDSQVLIDYFAALGDDLSSISAANKLYNIGSWLDLIDDMADFFDPAKTPAAYLRNLATLIGLKLPPEDTTTAAVLRANIVEAIDWYKIKGTYQSLSVIAVINAVTFNIWDMYAKTAYDTFNRVEWFVGGENENPSAYPYGSGYFKSPHFGLEVVLNKVYDADASVDAPYDHLWDESYWNNIQQMIEDTRPVHTVPHYILFLNPQTDVSGSVTDVDGNIQTQALLDAGFGGYFFDGQDASPPDDWEFDEGTSDGTTDVDFDASFSSTLDTIDLWRLGAGNKGVDLDGSIWNGRFGDESPLEGALTSSNITEYDDRIEIEFTIPRATVLSGVSELGIYVNGNTVNEEMAVISVFPDIYKGTESELRILVILTKE